MSPHPPPESSLKLPQFYGLLAFCQALLKEAAMTATIVVALYTATAYGYTEIAVP